LLKVDLFGGGFDCFCLTVTCSAVWVQVVAPQAGTEIRANSVVADLTTVDLSNTTISTLVDV